MKIKANVVKAEVFAASGRKVVRIHRYSSIRNIRRRQNPNPHRVPSATCPWRCILPRMLNNPIFRESRRSTRVPLKIEIKVEGSGKTPTCEGETIVVNLHGALISMATALKVGLRISIYVVLTSKQASSRVVHADPGHPLHCGIELDKPQNIWGVSLPPQDWEEATAVGRF